VRGRLAGLGRGWGAGRGPCAVLACPPGELHDLALLCFGIALHAAGWRINYLGISTPLEHLARVADEVRPDLVVLAATMPGTLEPLRDDLAVLAQRVPVAIAGAAATPRLAAEIGARLLDADPVTEAQRIA
jgi:MerR family transcriptional regulator, light-induced transcriptional regulator